MDSANGLSRRSRRFVRILFIILAALALLYALLLIPDSPLEIPAAREHQIQPPFAWNQDVFWSRLETTFVATRRSGCASVEPMVRTESARFDLALRRLATGTFASGDSIFAELERRMFSVAPLAGACPQFLEQFRDRVSVMRTLVKRQSERWDMHDRRARETLYRLLYGGRGAVEEAMLQLPPDRTIPPLTKGTDEPSATPDASLLGITIHSGDILVSRGGVPTSALIARGNDFQGNFSHVAMVWIDPKLRLVKLIESHIERGVTVSSVEDYLRDTKLRVMVLRLRSDLPAVASDPLLPHRAASFALQHALAGHIAYDFELNWQDTTKYFCSEVVSDAYRRFGVDLWMGMSRISGAGLRRWLADFGVRNFSTQEPSDLEYDPQVRVVAEWRDPETLRQDHFDNAVTEAMLEDAERGAMLSYPWCQLPLARAAKGWSILLNWFGGVGPVPEGMSATSALKHQQYAARHARAKGRVARMAEQFRRECAYAAPYWRLLEFARVALSARS